MENNNDLFKVFEERWEEELRKTPFLNGFPTSTDSLDLCNADKIGRPKAEKWVQQLILNGFIQVQINAGPKHKDQLRHLFFESNTREFLAGNRSLFFSYPFLLLKNKNNRFSPLAAPILLWPVRMKNNPDMPDSWDFQFYPESACKLNPFLQFSLPTIFDEERIKNLTALILQYQKTQNFQPVIQFLHDLGEAASLEHEEPDNGIQPFPNASQAAILAEKGCLLWSGSLSVISSVHDRSTTFFRREASSAKLDHQFRKPPNPDRQLSANQHPFGLIKPDQDQEKILSLASSDQVIMVEGQPGTGKTGNLSNVIFNALSHRKTCLILAPRLKALQKIQETLVGQGLGGLVFLFTDLERDSNLFFEHVRRTIQNQKQIESFAVLDYQLALQKALKHLHKLRVAFQAANVNIFGKHNWTETVGRYLRSIKKEGKELLNSQLNQADFVFTFSEYEMLKEDIIQAQPLFEKVNTLNHALTAIHSELFLKQEKDDAASKITRLLDRYTNKAKNLQYRFIREMDTYTELLTGHYERTYRRMKAAVVELLENLDDFKNRYGAAFEESGMVSEGTLHVFGVFSHRHKEIKKLRDELKGQFLRLKKLIMDNPFFEYKFPADQDVKNLSRLRQTTIDFQIKLEHWKQQLPHLIQDETHRLNRKTVQSSLHFSDQIIDLENSLTVLIEEINMVNLLADSLSENRLTLHKKLAYIESIIEKFNFLKVNLRDFDVFYDWQKFWLGSGELTRALIKALTRVKPVVWIDAFESWYFHNKLLLEYTPAIPEESLPFADYEETWGIIQQILPDQIHHVWKEGYPKISKILRKKSRLAYKFLFSQAASERVEIGKIKDELPLCLNELQQISPVILATPEVAGQLFLSTEPEWINPDLVLLDDASYFSPEQLFGLFQRANEFISFQPSNPFQPSAGSLLKELATETGTGRQVFLETVHLPMPNQIRAFQQALFGNTYLEADYTPLHPKLNQCPFQVFSVHGRYEEASGINQEEISSILRLLRTIKPTPQRTYPDILIVCATREQRNELLYELLQIKNQQTDAAEQILQMERNGLRVLALEDLPGHRASILLFSFTYGSVNLKNQLTSEIFGLNSPEGIMAMTDLIAVGTEQIWLVHSLSQSHLQILANDWDNIGTALAANLFQYANACLRADEDQNRAILNRIIANRGIGAPVVAESLFYAEVRYLIQPFLESDRILLNYRHRGVYLPMLVRSTHPSEKGLVIVADGFLFHKGHGAFLWEEKFRKQLIEDGFRILSIFSAVWWKNPEQEARKLAALIIRDDNQLQDQ